jgi:hypothetical protein
MTGFLGKPSVFGLVSHQLIEALILIAPVPCRRRLFWRIAWELERSSRRNVCYWHFGDIYVARLDVRFRVPLRTSVRGPLMSPTDPKRSLRAGPSSEGQAGLHAAGLLLDEIAEAPVIEQLELGAAGGDEVDPRRDVRHHGLGCDAEGPDPAWAALKARLQGKVGVVEEVAPPRTKGLTSVPLDRLNWVPSSSAGEALNTVSLLPLTIRLAPPAPCSLTPLRSISVASRSTMGFAYQEPLVKR